MSEIQEYTDESTGTRITVEHDIPGHPRISAYPPREDVSIEDFNQAVHRLMIKADLIKEYVDEPTGVRMTLYREKDGQFNKEIDFTRPIEGADAISEAITRLEDRAVANGHLKDE